MLCLPMAFPWQSLPRKHRRHGSIPPEQIYHVFTVMALGSRYQDENLSISNCITTVGTLEECLAEIHGPTLTRCRWWRANGRLSTAERAEPNGRVRRDCFHGLLAERTLERSNPIRPQMGNQRPETRGARDPSVSHRWVEPDLKPCCLGWEARL